MNVTNKSRGNKDMHKHFRNRKLVIGLVALVFIAMAVMSTVSYFSKQFVSDNNVITSEKFSVNAVNSSGETIGNAQFSLGDKLFPGMAPIEAYQFAIKKNDTTLPVEYKVNLTPSGELFPAGINSPIVLNLQRNENNAWVDINLTNTFKLENETDNFRILVSWPHSSNDIAFQAKTGNIHLEVVATQVDPAVPVAIDSNVVNTIAGEAAVTPAKTIVSYRIDKAIGGQTSAVTFIVNDGDGFLVDSFRPTTYNAAARRANTPEEMARSINTVIHTSPTTSPKFAALKEKFTIENVGRELVFTSKENKAYNNFSIVVPETTLLQGEFLVKQAGGTGHDGIKEVNTLTVNGAINDGGTTTVIFEDGSVTVTKSIAISKTDTHASIAAKIATELTGLSGWDVTNASGSAEVVFTAKTAGADKSVNITLTNN